MVALQLDPFIVLIRQLLHSKNSAETTVITAVAKKGMHTNQQAPEQQQQRLIDRSPHQRGEPSGEQQRQNGTAHQPSQGQDDHRKA